MEFPATPEKPLEMKRRRYRLEESLHSLPSQQTLTHYLFSRAAPRVSQEEKVSTRDQGLDGDPQVPEEHRSSTQEGTLLSPGESNRSKPRGEYESCTKCLFVCERE